MSCFFVFLALAWEGGQLARSAVGGGRQGRFGGGGYLAVAHAPPRRAGIQAAMLCSGAISASWAHAVARWMVHTGTVPASWNKGPCRPGDQHGGDPRVSYQGDALAPPAIGGSGRRSLLGADLACAVPTLRPLCCAAAECLCYGRRPCPGGRGTPTPCLRHGPGGPVAPPLWSTRQGTPCVRPHGHATATSG